MLTDFEIKNLQTLKNMLDGIKKERADAEKGLKEIDEKYKAIIDKEKKELREKLSACKKEVEFWEKPIIKRYGKPVDELLAKPEDVAETEEVSDDLPFSDDEEKVVDAEAVEETKEETSEDPGPEFDGAGFTEADNEPTQQELDSANEFEAEQAKKSDDAEDWESESEVKSENDDDAWPEFPEEWK